MPRRPEEWRPSQRACTYGIDNKTQFFVTARRIGAPSHFRDAAGRLRPLYVWRGCFQDRDDADAFLFAAVTGSLSHERPLWRLPSPEWFPDFGEGLVFEFNTVTFFTASPGSNQTWTRPGDFQGANNLFECIGGGGAGGQGQPGTWSGDCGGSGAAYAQAKNYNAAATETYQIGAGGPKQSSNAGAAGGNTWLGAATFAASQVGASGGGGGQILGGGSTPGQASACIGGLHGGTTNPGAPYAFSGGAGQTIPNGTVVGGSGGGAAGPDGAGGAGTTTSGTADNGLVAGVGADTAGNSGTNSWTSNPGGVTAGAGSGGGQCSVNNNGNNGGLYGGGGSANDWTAGTLSGAGGQGILVVTYGPPIFVPYTPYTQLGPLLAQ